MRVPPTFRVVVCSLLFVSVLQFRPAGAQTSTAPLTSSDKVDRNAYQTLFRRVLVYDTLADQADAAHTPKPHLRRVLANRLGLSDDDSATLKNLALAYQNESTPVRAQIVASLAKFHARFPGGIAAPGVDRSPPPELLDLQRQQDAITLRYRDLLRNSVSADTFQRVHAIVQSTFGTGIKPNSPQQ